MGGESIYYGLNALSNNLIMADTEKAEESKWSDTWYSWIW